MVPSLLLASLLVASTFALAQVRPSQPEPASGWNPKQLSHAKHYMVAAANPLAVDAGVRMLEQGGNAIDAMVATQLVLNLVEPSSSGIGGGAFLLYYDAKAKAIRAIDGRETAPAAATPNLFMGADGKPMPFLAARVGGRSVGVPGTPRLLEIAHLRFGKLPWKKVFEPAIEVAEKGFPVTPRFYKLIGEDKGLADEPAARAYFFDEQGQPKAVGTIIRNPEFAATLRKIADGGADAYYTGDIASDIVAAVHAHRNPGTLELQDLAGYKVREVEAVCGIYRAYKLCGMPPSSSGGIAVLQILGELSRFDMQSIRPNSSQAVHVVSEAERLAFADRNKYVADDRFVDVPVAGLLDSAYLRDRSMLIQPEKSMGKAEAGHPAGVKVAYDDDPVDEIPGTTQIAIIDGEGNAVSMTTTIESFFGSRIMVHGFLLNNELTDFNFQPVEDGVGVANSVAPGKRPRSSMAPFLVFDGKTGKLDMAIGSPGGSLIIGYVAKALVGIIDWKLDVQKAIDLPNFGSRNGPTEIEKGTQLEAIEPALKAMGHDVRAIDMTSGIQGIRVVAGGLEGGADPRREGVARGH
ncbi:MAG TPA: gamma-glutamyltransferase [Usitatibacter sp.]|nr:gamma-glutamyltransferase [Usitatibacter sp.]